ncbi:MAG: helix-turn-helix domain-containing protein [Sciscionella sp.]
MVEARRAPDPGASEIGQRVRMIRKRRGLSLDAAAGLAGISKPYLSHLETGKRNFERRSLLENLAAALGCSVADLTGQPYLPPPDRATAAIMAELPAIRLALYDTPLDDAPDVSARPVEQLVNVARQANEHCDETRYSLAFHELGALLAELHVHVATGDTSTRRAALSGLVEACIVVYRATRQHGNFDLSVQAAQRAYDAATTLGDPTLSGFAGLCRASVFSQLGARRRADSVLSNAMVDTEPFADPTGANVGAAESFGVMHLLTAQLASRDGRGAEAQAHLGEARDIATATGERNTMHWRFGPANVTVWALGVSVELGNGPSAAERFEADPPRAMSTSRLARLHFDLARAYAQADGDRDTEALRHLDRADRVSPQRMRLDPMARDLVVALSRRARRRVWELDSLRNRFGVR